MKTSSNTPSFPAPADGSVRVGTVYIVGAGPGDPGLITCRGWSLLQAADVIFHDALVSPELMELLPEQVERIDVGKRARRHRSEQAGIHRLLIAAAQAGRVVVRLKGGDPLVFGRGGEEMEALRAAGVPYELVPGVSAAVAVPAMAGIPVTHRDLSGAVTFVTGHDAGTAREGVSWHALAGTDHTLVVLMGLARLPAIADRLVASGRAPDTPVAVIEQASTPRQRVVLGTLADIADRVEEAGIQAPATTVVGPVAALAARLSWR